MGQQSKRFQTEFNKIDRQITEWMANHGVLLLRISVGIVFFWFGILKFFPSLSPAEDLASRTIEVLSFGIVQAEISLPVLAGWEVLIGLGLITGKFMRGTLLLLILQMLGTITPMFLFPNETWQVFPISPTLEGQYIIKNLVLVSAGIAIGATVRGGNLVADREVVENASRQYQKSQVTL